MLEGPYLITETTVRVGQISLGFFSKLIDFFSIEQVFRVEWYGPSYKKEGWWIFARESGEKLVIEVRGKPAFCEAVLKHLERHPLQLVSGATVQPQGNVHRIS